MSALAQTDDDLPDHVVEALADLIADALVDGTPGEQLARLRLLFRDVSAHHCAALFDNIAEIAVEPTAGVASTPTARLQ